MTAFFQSEEVDCIVNREHPYRSFVAGPSASPARRSKKSGRNSARDYARAGVRGFNKLLKNVLEAIVAAKMRRLERELRFYGVGYRPPVNDSRTHADWARERSGVTQSR